MEAEGIPDRRLRGEARSVWLETLTADQQRAFKVLIDLIGAATRDLDSREKWLSDPRFDRGLDERSTSRVLLLGGGRGSGKTTVASTLQKALTSKDDLYEHAPEEGTPEQKLKQAVDELRPNVIVLEPLSMDETPSETNVLAALLARIEQLLFPNLTYEDTPSTAGGPRQHSAVLELLRLQTDVAIAWNGNLTERKGELDPDNYAMEELRVERVRLQLRKRFATVLRQTARDSLDHRDQPALFLLIVDDADVNPAKLIDLLERLRMVAVVELVVLLVGDVRAMEAAFRLHFANRFRLDQGRGIEPDKIGMNPKEMSSLTNSIGRSALRKHVPYHQRVILQPLKARESVELSPLRRTRRRLGEMLGSVSVSYPAVPHWAWMSNAEQVRLKKLETEAARADEELPQQQQQELASLRKKAEHRTPLDTFVFPKAEIKQDSGEKSWYVGSRVLADSPRVAIDLWNTLRDVRSEKSSAPKVEEWADGGSVQEHGAQRLDPRLHTLFRQLAAERLDSKTDLWDENSPINDALRETIIRDGNLDALDLVATHHVKYVSDTPRELVLANPKVPGDRVYWSRHNGLQFEVMGKRASRREIGPLVLVEDLWSLENRTAAEQAAAERRRSDLIWVVSQDQAARDREQERLREDDGDEGLWAQAPDRSEPSDGAGQAKEGPKTSDDERRSGTHPPQRTGASWPVPMYRTTRQVEQFGYMWNAFLSWWEPDQRSSGRAGTDESNDDAPTAAEPTDPRVPADDFVDAWIACHTWSLVGKRPARIVRDAEAVEAAKPKAASGSNVESEPNENDESNGDALSNDEIVSLDDAVKQTKGLLKDLADYLAGDDEWAATIACDWLASVGWLLERVRDEDLTKYLGTDFLADHQVCLDRIKVKIDDLMAAAGST